MSINKPTEIDSNGVIKEIIVPIVSTGVAEANKLIQSDATGKIDNSWLPTGIGADTETIEASEALSAGDYVNTFNDGGTVKVRLADASDISTKADGFVLASVLITANAEVYRRGLNNQLAGLTLTVPPSLKVFT